MSIKFLNPMTGKPFRRAVQSHIQQQALRLNLPVRKNRFFVTASQAVRLCNTIVKPGAKGIRTKAGSTHAYPVNRLPLADQRELLQQHPPYFGVGVGLFTDGKWFQIKNAHVCASLNPESDTRKLFVDAVTAETQLSGRFSPTDAVEVASGQNEVTLYHASETTDPDRVGIPLGLAINPVNGHRYSEPSRSKLITAARVAGFLSPMWLTKNQVEKYYHLKLKDNAQPVSVSARHGFAINLSVLPVSVQKQLRKTLPKKTEGEGDNMQLFDCGNWEYVMRNKLLMEMLRFSNKQTKWVTAIELQRLQLLKIDVLRAIVAKKKGVIDLKAATRVNLYNGCQLKSGTALLQPKDRSFCLVDGEYVNSARTQQLLDTQKKKNWISPVWLSPKELVAMGCKVRPGERPIVLKQADAQPDGIFNITDVENYEDFLKEQRPIDGPFHQIFQIRWRPITTKYRVKQLDTFVSEKNQNSKHSRLWIEHTELAISGLVLKKDAKEHLLEPPKQGPNATVTNKLPSSKHVFNIEQTANPLQCLALCKYLMATRFA